VKKYSMLEEVCFVARKLLTSRPEGVLTIHEGRNLMLLDGRDRNSSRLR